MSTLAIVLIVLAALVVLLALGGAIANARREREGRERFARQVDDANRAQAAAHAADKGWERGALEAAARRAVEAERPGQDVRELSLVQVVDLPGVDEDQAVFRAVTGDGEHVVTLSRRGGEWALERIA